MLRQQGALSPRGPLNWMAALAGSSLAISCSTCTGSRSSDACEPETSTGTFTRALCRLDRCGCGFDSTDRDVQEAPRRVVVVPDDERPLLLLRRPGRQRLSEPLEQQKQLHSLQLLLVF